MIICCTEVNYVFGIVTNDVRWSKGLSVSFTLSNDIRQEGVLSSLLINLYTNELNVTLNSAPISCCFVGVVINHLIYADDLVRVYTLLLMVFRHFLICA